MASAASHTAHHWLRTGDEMFAAMLAAIDAAQASVRLEVYIYAPGAIGEQFRDACVRAQRRGVRVRVLIDAFGSLSLPLDYWEPLTAAGGEARWFNPVTWTRLAFRNHRKLLVCDEQVAFVGGFNLAPEYAGDGIRSGWRDLGVRLDGPLAVPLAAGFDDMFARADFRHKRFPRLLPWRRYRPPAGPTEQILASGPGPRSNPIREALRADLARARQVQIIAGYFLPTWRLRRDLAQVARRGGRVQLMLAGKSDVRLSQLAAQSQYRRFLKPGVEIYEYEPQILHAKLIIVDAAVYVGSSNLDPRSLRINYEMMVRFHRPEMAAEARALFAEDLKYCRRIELETWRRSRSLWQRLQQRFAYLLLVRIDPHLARQAWRTLPD